MALVGSSVSFGRWQTSSGVSAAQFFDLGLHDATLIAFIRNFTRDAAVCWRRRYRANGAASGQSRLASAGQAGVHQSVGATEHRPKKFGRICPEMYGRQAGRKEKECGR